MKRNAEEIRAAIARADESRATTEQRKLSDAEQACLTLSRSCRAICSAAIMYSYDVPGVVTDVIYYALRDCYDCCDVFIGLLNRQSALAPDAAELCAAACAAAVEACAGSADPMLQACSSACTQTIATCNTVAESGGSDGNRSAARSKVEVRQFQELRAKAADAAPAIVGYPIVFNKLSEPLGDAKGRMFRELIKPDAIQFTEDVRADFNHDNNCILGRRSKGTLALEIDGTGVNMQATPPDTQWARDLVTSIDRGDIDQGSFTFRVLPGGEQWTKDAEGQSIRTLSKILVSRVSVVSDPAYTATKLQLRSMDDILAGRPADSAEQSAPPATDQSAGQAAPPAQRSAAGAPVLLSQRLDMAEREF